MADATDKSRASHNATIEQAETAKEQTGLTREQTGLTKGLIWLASLTLFVVLLDFGFAGFQSKQLSDTVAGFNEALLQSYESSRRFERTMQHLDKSILALSSVLKRIEPTEAATSATPPPTVEDDSSLD